MEGKNLQQRLLEVREQIPALSKKKYNEEVNYDFTRIDDIYKYLTPAMNRAGGGDGCGCGKSVKEGCRWESGLCVPAG